MFAKRAYCMCGQLYVFYQLQKPIHWSMNGAVADNDGNKGSSAGWNKHDAEYTATEDVLYRGLPGE